MRTMSKPSSIQFKLVADQKIYRGNLTLDDGTASLPLMVNSLMVNLTRDYPDLHSARSLQISVKVTAKPKTKPQ